jgi:hypothetical protein
MRQVSVFAFKVAYKYRLRRAFRLFLVYKYFFSINIVYESLFIYGVMDTHKFS